MNDSSIRPPERALARTPAPSESGQRVTGFQRAAGAVRMALPLVQRLLPLLDGNIGSTVSNLINPHRPAPPPPPVDLTPIEESLAEIQSELRGLQAQMAEQNAAGDETLKQAFKRVESQIETLSQAAGRNTLQQQELLQGLKAIDGKVESLKAGNRRASLFAAVALGLLALSILVNVFLLLHFWRFLP